MLAKRTAAIAMITLMLGATVADAQRRSRSRRSNRARHQRQVQPQTPRLAGPRRTIAVAKFDANEAFRRAYGDTDLGGGLAAMLVSALERSGRFIVVERAELKGTLSEQQLAADGLSSGPSAAKAGRLYGAQLLIYGSVTQFSQNESGGGGGLGVNVGGFLGGLSPRSTKGRVGMVLRIVDTTTGEVVKTVRVKETVTDSGVDFKFGTRGLDFNASTFKKTPVGKAAQKAVDKAVGRIIGAASARPWSGRVVAVRGQRIGINGGSRTGLTNGRVLVIAREGEALTDPETGEVLDRTRVVLGKVRIVEVSEKLSWAVPVTSLIGLPKRGDAVTLP